MTSLAAQSDPMDSDEVPRLGGRLRALRTARGISARTLAKSLGISASAVSQIERGVMQPSVSRLIAITDALGVPLADVFDDAGATDDERRASSEDGGDGFTLVRAHQSTPVSLESGVTFRRLSPRSTSELDLFESVYSPGSTATGDNALFRHEGYEIGSVVSGELTIEFDDETVVLAPGDSISYPCSKPHRIRNASSRPAVATWLIVHP
ncbi:helix-turn-helix domain-containing protein [Agromyces sp. ISL-38]|uniref:helix-turn-helix domain-containing protein n=1 Tax=Agromyces sp. ISL-38 TaxID=2819107 RepID=UPI001BEB87AF|nr:helix-turn-helix domain-containing protein [Agromyces sp. ISL-38]MBT2498248.1 helix-turn-helix domain-containing protein [Agromyces sp. ISL-38]MBT2519330.1 helix-turn-helix domain-containing protein [Streptomyces sp. ISL-90]